MKEPKDWVPRSCQNFFLVNFVDLVETVAELGVLFRGCRTDQCLARKEHYTPQSELSRFDYEKVMKPVPETQINPQLPNPHKGGLLSQYPLKTRQ